MLVTVRKVLSPAALAHCRARLEAAAWTDGRATAGAQSALAKRNLQLAEDSVEALELGELVLSALQRCPEFLSAALPLAVHPPMFNRYDLGMGFGDHVDNAIRVGAARRLRADVSCTLFLTEPADYDGGELVIRDTFGEHRVKGAAGDMVVYPSSSLHRVEPVTRGGRWASVFWVQSMVRRDDQRALLFQLDQDVAATRAALGDEHPTAVSLTAGYHNLVRMWGEV
jgi:PKHD-type hydroxylase